MMFALIWLPLESWKIWCPIRSLDVEQVYFTSWNNGPTMCFITLITTDWMRYGDRHDDCSGTLDILLCLPETDAPAAKRWNNWCIFIVTLGHCVPLDSRCIIQVPVRAWHSQLWLLIQRYRQHASQLSLCALRKQLLRTNNSRTGSKQSKGSWRFIWKPRWDTLRRVPLLGLYHPLPGRCAPSAWPNRPTDSAAITSTSAILRELWATRPLTHRVCLRGQNGGKWGTAEDSQRVCLVCEWISGMMACQWQMCTLKTVQEKMAGNGSVSVSKLCCVLDAVLSWNGLDYNSHIWQRWKLFFIMFNLAK